MKIAGLWSGHDASFCILDNGIPTLHAELERYIREKEPQGDSIALMDKVYPEWRECEHLVTCFPSKKLQSFPGKDLLADKKIHIFGHHISHAAHAFYSSDFENAKVFTIDGGGIEDENGSETATTVWNGSGLDLQHIRTFHPSQVNIGGLWTRATRYIFELQNGWPYGHQAGTVMAMAALGDSRKYYDDFLRMLTSDLVVASAKPHNQPVGPLVKGKDPAHPYMEKWRQIANRSDQERFDLAAGLQHATETIIRQLIGSFITQDDRNICIAGGVALNSVAMGKIYDWFPWIENAFVPAVPYDGGLCIGAAQYLYHSKMRLPRVPSNKMIPYLGETYGLESIKKSIDEFSDNLITETCTDRDVINLLNNKMIVSVFRQGSESGRRALGNRSIFADPRSNQMKDIVNEKVKHRQWFRPFAPMIIREDVKDYFERDVSSPYMGFVMRFREEYKEKVPAVVHFDGTARLQTVEKDFNPWLYNFLSAWKEKSGTSVLLNTSFNDREPIVETPYDAIKCFLSTNIDYLYFADEGLIIKKR
jgi:carbamoyltransferase